MSFLLPCPHCGPRDVNEFATTGEVLTRSGPQATRRELSEYVYLRRNVAGVQREWWYHRLGCKQWFIGTRDTVTNTVHNTAWFAPEKGTQDAQEHHPDSTATA